MPLYYIIESNNQTNYPNVNPIIWSIAINLTRIQDIPARIPGLRPNTIYRFRVTAYNALGRSPTSNVSDPITTTSAGIYFLIHFFCFILMLYCKTPLTLF